MIQPHRVVRLLSHVFELIVNESSFIAHCSLLLSVRHKYFMVPYIEWEVQILLSLNKNMLPFGFKIQLFRTARKMYKWTSCVKVLLGTIYNQASCRNRSRRQEFEVTNFVQEEIPSFSDKLHIHLSENLSTLLVAFLDESLCNYSSIKGFVGPFCCICDVDHESEIHFSAMVRVLLAIIMTCTAEIRMR